MGMFFLLRNCLRNDFWASFGLKAMRSEPLEMAISELRLRSTSWKSDETICLGTLMGFNLTKLQQIEAEIRAEYQQHDPPLRDDEPVPDGELAMRRMKTLLRMVKVIPKQIIFWPQKRLNEVGFGWAPATFAGNRHKRSHSGSFAEPDMKAILDPHGRGLADPAAGFLFRLDPNTTTLAASDIIICHVTHPNTVTTFEVAINVNTKAEASTNFFWDPKTLYGIILCKPVSHIITALDAQAGRDPAPQSVPGLELWFESLFSTSTMGLEIDAVIGPVTRVEVRGGQGEDVAKREAEWVQIRHGCVGRVAFTSLEVLREFERGVRGEGDATGRGKWRRFPEVDGGYLDLYAGGDYVKETLDGLRTRGF